jgi:hypothetical protein
VKKKIQWLNEHNHRVDEHFTQWPVSTRAATIKYREEEKHERLFRAIIDGAHLA